jgi:diguanylate cyclase (GGDEF)-like protein
MRLPSLSSLHLLPDSARLQLDAESRSQLLQLSYRVVLALILFGLAMSLAILDRPIQYTLVGAALVALIGERLCAAGRHEWTAQLLIYMLAAAIFLLAWNGDGIHDQAIFLYGPTMVLAVVFLPLRDYLICAALIAAGILDLGIGTWLDGVRPWYGAPEGMHIWPDITFLLIAHFANVFLLNSTVSHLGRYLLDETNRLTEESAVWRKAAITDALSGAFNRRGFMEHAKQQHRRAQEEKTPLAVLMIDIDHFKTVNDKYGHAIGDFVIQNLAQKLRLHFRSTDIVGRLGGEEFCVLLTGVDYERAEYSAEHFRRDIAEESIATTAGPLNYTISVGFAWMKHKEPLSALMQIADKALYRAKHNGRNCVMAGTYWDTLMVGGRK